MTHGRSILLTTMKRRSIAWLAVFAILLSLAWCGYVLDAMTNWFSVRWLEFQVRRNVDPIELQTWAINLLAKHSHQFGGYQDFYGTNAPASLTKVMAGLPNIRIFATNEVVVCGATKGGPYLVVGPPTLVTPDHRRFIHWKPGIYFVQ